MNCVLDVDGVKAVVAALNALAKHGMLRGGRSLRSAVAEVRASETGRTVRIVYALSGRPSVVSYKAGKGFGRELVAAVDGLEPPDMFEVESALNLLARCGLLFGGRGFSKRVEGVRFDVCGRLRIRYADGRERTVQRGKARLLVDLRVVKLKKDLC
ncbi:MAG: hypothetical protein ACO2PN_24345 [Pyrobaculum sp.]|jgi:hypothetical protein